MDCRNLSREEKRTIQKIALVILYKNSTLSLDKVMEKIYDYFHSFSVEKYVVNAKNPDRSKAEDNTLEYTTYSAKFLSRLMNREEGNEDIVAFREAISSFAPTLSFDNISNYTSKDFIKSKFSTPDNYAAMAPIDIVGIDKVAPFIEEMRVAFNPEGIEEASITEKKFIGDHKDIVTPFQATKVEGKPVILRRVTEFAKGLQEKSLIQAKGVSIGIGNVSDYAFKYFLNNFSTSSYNDMISKLMKDEQLRKHYYNEIIKDVNVRNFKNEFDLQSAPPQATGIFDSYLEDMLKALTYQFTDFINKYKDYYIMSGEQIYDKELGLVGTPDFIAINPEKGTFKVIDLKVRGVKEGPTSIIDKEEGLQVNAYATIIEKNTSLKPEMNDIFSIEVAYSLVNIDLASIEKKPTVRIKILGNKSKTFNFSKETLKKQIDAYKKNSDLRYNPQNLIFKNDIVKPLNILARPRRRNKGNTPTELRFKIDDAIETPEALNWGIRWMKRVMPEIGNNIQVISTLSSGKAGAEWFADVIKFYTLTNKGVTYHEGWHNFSQLYLTKKEKLSLYKRIREKNIVFNTRDGRVVDLRTADLLDVEEFLAEEFKNFALANIENRDYSFPFEDDKQIKNIFQRIWDAIKRFFGLYNQYGDMTFNEIFSNLYNGNINTSNFSQSNAIFNNLASLYISNESGEEILDNATFLKMRTIADTILENYMSMDGKLITDYFNSRGVDSIANEIQQELIFKKDDLQALYNDYSDKINNAEDIIQKSIYEQNRNGIGSIIQVIDKILSNYEDFIDAYMVNSNFDVLREFSRKNKRNIRKVLENRTKIINDEGVIELDNNIDEDGEMSSPNDEDFDFDIDNIDFKFNTSGNEREASQWARAVIKDFFSVIKRMPSATRILGKDEDYSSMIENDTDGLPVTLPMTEAFGKTLSILQGSFELEEVKRRMNDPANYERFPELNHVRIKLFGGISENGDRIIGVFERLDELQELIDNNKYTDSEYEEYRRKLQFRLHFMDIMSYKQVEFRQLLIDLTSNNQLYGMEGNNKKSAIFTRENLENSVSYIINKFVNGFTQNVYELEENSLDKKLFRSDLFKTVSEVVRKSMIGANNESIIKSIENTPYLFDDVTRKYHYNPFYVKRMFSRVSSTPSSQDIKKVLNYLGINISDYAYSNPSDIKELRSIYYKMRDIFDEYANQTIDNIKSYVYDREGSLKSAIIEYNRIMSKGADITNSDNATLLDLKEKMRRYANKIFPFSPVSNMLSDSTTKYLTRDKYIFSVNLSLFISLANIQKKYEKDISYGSVYVGKDNHTEYTFFRNNQMTMLTGILNEHDINSVDDLDKYPVLNTLNPKLNPYLWNSAIINNIFDRNTGKRIKENKFSVQILSQMRLNTGGQDIVKKISEMNMDEKLLTDILLYITEGRTEMRRMEASNSSWMIGLQKDGKNIPFIDMLSKSDSYTIQDGQFVFGYKSFSDPRFTIKVMEYVQWAASKYAYYLNNPNEKTEKEKKGNSHTDKLSIFDEMLPEADKIKKFIKSKISGDPNYNLNNLFYDISKEDPNLFTSVNKSISNYFEGIAISNEDSFKNEANKTLSEKSKDILRQIDDIHNQSPNAQILGYTEKSPISDSVARHVIANDFIMVMEDSMLLFGDFAMYTDPIKRRKIIGNNGSINYVTEELSKKLQTLNKLSISDIYAKHKGRILNKDYTLIRKEVIKDMKVPSFELKDFDPLSGKELTFIKNILDIEDVTKKFTPEQREERRKELLDFEEVDGEIIAKGKYSAFYNALKEMEIADGTGYISLDLYRQLLMREETWTDNHELEYKRQVYIQKRILGYELSEAENTHVNNGPYMAFNIAKVALTGPEYLGKSGPLLSTFDKMALSPMIPEYHPNTRLADIYYNMLDKNLDYVVFDSAQKGRKHTAQKAFNDDYESVYNGEKSNIVQHHSAFLKMQVNMSTIHNDSVLSTQLRDIYDNIILEYKATGRPTDALLNRHKSFVKLLGKLIKYQSSKMLDEMGLKRDGTLDSSTRFMDYIAKRLTEQGDVDENLLSLLHTNKNNTFSTILEALPIHTNVMDMISGMIDDNFREIRLNGSKLIQTSELGTTLKSLKLSKEDIGTVQLKSQQIIRDKDGNIRMTEVQAKVPFREQFIPLLNKEFTYVDKQGNESVRKIRGATHEESIRNLNIALRDPKWVAKNRKSLTFYGVRIPLQDQSFAANIIIAEFLPQSMGDTIVLPPEFYKQTGSDNDADTVTVTFKYLDKDTGDPISIKGVEDIDYDELVSNINKLQAELNELKEEKEKPKDEVNIDLSYSLSEQYMVDIIVQLAKDERIYSKLKVPLSKLREELELQFTEDMKGLTVKGLSEETTLYKIYKKGKDVEFIEAIDAFISDAEESRFPKNKNRTTKEILDDETSVSEKLKELRKIKKLYKKGIQNGIVNEVMYFLGMPENYSYITDTDTIEPIQHAIENILSNRYGREVKLGRETSALDSMGYFFNLNSHVNNFNIRAMLGSFVKFSRILRGHVMKDTYLNRKFKGGSLDKLSKGIARYDRYLYTPLLYNVDSRQDTIPLTVYDENGVRVTKNLSSITTSLLDLFKNIDIFPSAGISWNNVKQLLLLMGTGVPMERALLFLNNPVLREIEKKSIELGSDYQYRHAIVATAEDILKDPMFTSTYNIMGSPNILMLRPAGQISKLSVDLKDIKFSEEILKEMDRDFQEYTDRTGRGLALFLREDGSKYSDIAEKIFKYYTLLTEDADYFYKFGIKPMDRDSKSYASFSKISSAQSVERQIATTGLFNSDFLDKNRGELSTTSIFYNDEVIKNILSNVYPTLMNIHPTLTQGLIFMIKQLTNSVNARDDEKKRMETVILSDFISMIVNNLYVMKDERGKNFLAAWFENDIHTQLSFFRRYNTKRNASGEREVRNDENLLKSFSTQNSSNIESLIKKNLDKELSDKDRKDFIDLVSTLNPGLMVEEVFKSAIFANQFDYLTSKYPELLNVNLVKSLVHLKTPGRKDPGLNPTTKIDPDTGDIMYEKEDDGITDLEDEFGRKIPVLEGGRDFKLLDIYNSLTQSYLSLNMPGNPSEKNVMETVLREEWKHLKSFSLDKFPLVYQQASLKGETDKYTNPENVKEISKFFDLLTYYSLAQGSHLGKGRSSFAHLAPVEDLTRIVKESMDNFASIFKNEDGSLKRNVETDVTRILEDGFQPLFISIHHDDYNWNSDIQNGIRKGLYPRYYKGHASKMYDKINSSNPIMEKRQSLVGNSNIFNNFTVNNVDEDPFKCYKYDL